MPAELSALVQSAQQGDEYAFRMLYRELQPGLLRYLTVLVGSDAEDVASETWLQIARDLPAFAGGPGFRAWATRVARNRALDHLRHQRRRPTVPVPIEALSELPGAEDTAASADEWLGTDTAVALIASLPRTEAEAVLLRTVIGLDAESTARVLGKRPGAVRTAAHRGLRRLARVLAQNAVDGATEPAADGAPAVVPVGDGAPAAAPTADVRSSEDVEAGQGWR